MIDSIEFVSTFIIRQKCGSAPISRFVGLGDLFERQAIWILDCVKDSLSTGINKLFDIVE